MAINYVNYKVGTSAAYSALASKDTNTLYFLTDTLKIMKGDQDFTADVIFVDELPSTGIEGKIYVVDNVISAYVGGEFKTLSDPDIKANLSGATFTGEVILAADPTNALGAATKQYVDNSIGANDAMRFKGTIGTDGTITALPTTDVRQGDTYKVITAGTYAGAVCEVGDMIIALENKETGSTDANWTVVQANIDGAVTGPATSTASDIAVFDGSTGKVISDSGKKVGGATLAETADENTLATETAVKTYVDAAKPAWVEI